VRIVTLFLTLDPASEEIKNWFSMYRKCRACAITSRYAVIMLASVSTTPTLQEPMLRTTWIIQKRGSQDEDEQQS
jgi:hypothetical protein